MKTLKERLEDKTLLDPNSGCYLWTGSVANGGYGQISVNSIMTLVHRVSWQLHRGTIPKGLCVCHHCDVRICIRPEHLFLDTHKGNMTDMYKKGRSNMAKGEKNGFSKFKEKQIIEIRKLYETGRISQYKLAEKFNTSRTQIQRIVERRLWKHI